MKFIYFFILFSCGMCGNIFHAWSLPCSFLDSKKCVYTEKFLQEVKRGCAGDSSKCRYRFCSANCLTSENVKKDKSFCLQQCGSTETLAMATAEERRIFYGTILQDPQKIFLTEARVHSYKTKIKSLTEEDTELFKSLVLGSASQDTTNLVSRKKRVL